MTLTESIIHAKTWDTSAFGRLYDASYDRVYRYIFHRVLDTLHTEDIVSEVYHKALKNIKKLRGNTEGEYFSWIFQIAYTTIIDHSRRTVDIDSIEEIAWEWSHEDSAQIDEKDKLREILEYMKYFSEKERSILTMRIWDDLSYEEISAITGESPSTIRKIVSRTLMKITANVSALSLLILLSLHVW